MRRLPVHKKNVSGLAVGPRRGREGGGGGGVTCICHDTEMCHYFGYFLDCFWIFGCHFLVKFICLGIIQIFG